MNNNISRQSSSIRYSSPCDGSSIIKGVTELLKDTDARNAMQKMVDNFEHLGEAPLMPRQGQRSLPTSPLRQLPIMERVGSGNTDNSRLALNDSKSAHRVPRQQALVPRGEPEVVIHAGVRQVSVVEQPGVIARTRTSCLTFLQRCFGRATR